MQRLRRASRYLIGTVQVRCISPELWARFPLISCPRPLAVPQVLCAVHLFNEHIAEIRPVRTVLPASLDQAHLPGNLAGPLPHLGRLRCSRLVSPSFPCPDITSADVPITSATVRRCLHVPDPRRFRHPRPALAPRAATLPPLTGQPRHGRLAPRPLSPSPQARHRPPGGHGVCRPEWREETRRDPVVRCAAGACVARGGQSEQLDRLEGLWSGADWARQRQGRREGASAGSPLSCASSVR